MGDGPTRLIVRYVHIGSFSGSAPSLRAALEDLVEVEDVDLAPVLESPPLRAARWQALREKRRTGADSVVKTSACSRALQRYARRRGLVDGSRPTLFVQSLPAFVLDRSVRYAVYTDRVALEGGAAATDFRSRFSPQWLAREQAFLLGAERIYLMGASTVPWLVERYGVVEDRIVVVGAGPNTGVRPSRPRPACRTLLFVTTDWELEGGPQVLAAFDRVRAEVPDLRLLVVGRAVGTAAHEGVEDLGWVPHARMADIYARADALVIPSHMDAFPISLIEGLTAGLPCIGTRVGNQESIIGDGGLYVTPGDVDELTAAMRTLVSDYPHHQRRALERAAELREQLSWRRVAEAIADDLTAWRRVAA